MPNPNPNMPDRLPERSMKEKPILFSGPMVRALLEKRKTQTRRVIKPQPHFPFGVKRIVLVPDPWHDSAFAGTPAEGMGNKGPVEMQFHCEDFAGNLVARWDGKCPYAIGQRLWVRETWAAPWGRDYKFPSGESGILYRADNSTSFPNDGHWKPSIHMPRWASRIDRVVTGIRAERLQDISEEDAFDEGCIAQREEPAELWEGYNRELLDRWGNMAHVQSLRENNEPAPDWMDEPRLTKYSRGFNISAKQNYMALWDSTYGKEHPWSSNPWLWVIEFKEV